MLFKAVSRKKWFGISVPYPFFSDYCRHGLNSLKNGDTLYKTAKLLANSFFQQR